MLPLEVVLLLVLRELIAQVLDLGVQIRDSAVDVLESVDEELVLLLLDLARGSRGSRDARRSRDGGIAVTEAGGSSLLRLIGARWA